MSLTLNQREGAERYAALIRELDRQGKLSPAQQRKAKWAKSMMHDERPSKHSPLRLVVVNDRPAYDLRDPLERIAAEMARVDSEVGASA